MGVKTGNCPRTPPHQIGERKLPPPLLNSPHTSSLLMNRQTKFKHHGEEIKPQCEGTALLHYQEQGCWMASFSALWNRKWIIRCNEELHGKVSNVNNSAPHRNSLRPSRECAVMRTSLLLLNWPYTSLLLCIGYNVIAWLSGSYVQWCLRTQRPLLNT